MKQAYIYRIKEDDEGTIGLFVIPELGFSCYTNELPDRNNKQGISRIPAGNYIVKPYSSKKFKDTFIILDVPGREYILIHTGNWAGDTYKNYISNSSGCVLVGNKISILNKQRCILNSVNTLAKINKITQRNSFKLTII